MAEAWAVVGIVASIVQLVDFSNRIVSHLDEFYSVVKEIPKSFRDIKTEFPFLSTTLEQIKEVIDSTSIADEPRKVLVYTPGNLVLPPSPCSTRVPRPHISPLVASASPVLSTVDLISK
jgi:hypothetical protein